MLGLQCSEIMIFWMSCSPIPPHVHPFPELHMTIPMSLDTPGGRNKSAKVPPHRSEGQVQGVKLKPWFLWTKFWFQNQCLGVKGLIWDHLGSIWRSRTGWRDCRRPRTTSRSEIVTLVLNMLETWFWCLSLGFGAWEIHWDYFQTPQMGPSGQNLKKMVKFSNTTWPPLSSHCGLLAKSHY